MCDFVSVIPRAIMQGIPLLFGGTAGGVLSALGAVGNTAPER